MASVRADQAEGLRRMLPGARTRTIAIVGGTRGAGATSCLVNLASALARHGLRVLIVDENFDSNVALALGIRPRFDLRHAVAGACTLQDVLVDGPSSTALLPAAALARAVPRLDVKSQRRAIACFAELDDLADVVLLDVRNDGLEPSPFIRGAQEVIVVASPERSAITGAYAAIKRMNRSDSRDEFRLLINRVQDFATMRLVEKNMREAARKHLEVGLDPLGAIPLDRAVVASTRRFSTAVEAAPTAAASRAFSKLAATILRWPTCTDDVNGLDIFMQRAIYGSRFSGAHAGV